MWEGIHAGESASPGRSERLAALARTCTGRDNSERALLILRGFDAMIRGENAEEVAEVCDRALVNGRLAPGLGWTDTEWGIELLMMLAGSYACTDRLDRAEALYTDALRTYESAGWSGGHLALAHAYVGFGHRRRGRLREAEAALRESLRLAERVGRGLPLYWSATCNLVETLLARGHVDEAWSVAEQYGFGPPYPSTIVLPDPQSVRGRLLLAVGRTEEGVNELEAAAKAAATRGHHNPVMVPWAVDLARALAGEDPVRAARLATDARRRAERFGTGTAIGEALRCAAALETGQRAVRLAEQAVACLESSPCQYEHAAARVEYGIAARSVAELQRGLALARSCGADGLVARARRELGLA
jgi:tetratricopeptide (TPR) repeat protein